MNSPLSIVDFIRDIYQTNEFIPLHAPKFDGNEKQYVNETLETTMVSSVGAYVNELEKQIEKHTGSSHAIAVVNGTCALQMGLLAAGVDKGSLVITQALTFVATCNAIHQLNAEPIFIDVCKKTLGLCPIALAEFLEENAYQEGNTCFHKESRKRISAVVPMHTFGHPAQIDQIISVCREWNIPIVEDAAESLGSTYKGQHTGTFGEYGAVSFNGNKIITTGGGGMVLCQDSERAKWIKHITTTAKAPHPFEFYHDEFAFNFRMPNINAALGCGQIEKLDVYIAIKRKLAMHYQSFFSGSEYEFVIEPEHSHSNYWLNAILCQSLTHRDELLKATNEAGVMTRPVWQLMTRLPMFTSSIQGSLENSIFLEERLVNIPSSPVDLPSKNGGG